MTGHSIGFTVNFASQIKRNNKAPSLNGSELVSMNLYLPQKTINVKAPKSVGRP